MKSELFFVAHLSQGVYGRSGEARGPRFEKTIFEIDEIPNLLHPLIYFIRGLLLTIGGYAEMTLQRHGLW